MTAKQRRSAEVASLKEIIQSLVSRIKAQSLADELLVAKAKSALRNGGAQ